MTNVLHLQARDGAPIACDMSGAPDTPAERAGEYRRLFERALLRRERRADAVVLALRAAAGIRAQVDDLARREAACCPFLDHRVETAGDEVIWTIAGDAVDVFYDLVGPLATFHPKAANADHRQAASSTT